MFFERTRHILGDLDEGMCRAELERGDVRQIPADYELDSVDVHALYPAGPRPSPKVRIFSDYLAAELGAMTPEPDRA
jgi:DNA-binding transcriptional LysR family regulator